MLRWINKVRSAISAMWCVDEARSLDGLIEFVVQYLSCARSLDGLIKFVVQYLACDVWM